MYNSDLGIHKYKNMCFHDLNAQWRKLGGANIALAPPENITICKLIFSVFKGIFVL